MPNHQSSNFNHIKVNVPLRDTFQSVTPVMDLCLFIGFCWLPTSQIEGIFFIWNVGPLRAGLGLFFFSSLH